MNAKYVSHIWRISLKLEGELERGGEIKKAIRKLMVDEEGKEM